MYGTAFQICGIVNKNPKRVPQLVFKVRRLPAAQSVTQSKASFLTPTVRYVSLLITNVLIIHWKEKEEVFVVLY